MRLRFSAFSIVPLVCACGSGEPIAPKREGGSVQSALTSLPAWTPVNAGSGRIDSFILRMRGELVDRTRAPTALLQGQRVAFESGWVKDPGLTSILTRHRALGVRQLFIGGGATPPARLAHNYRVEVAAIHRREPVRCVLPAPGKLRPGDGPRGYALRRHCASTPRSALRGSRNSRPC